ADPEPEPAATVEAASAAEPAPPPAATTTARTTPTPQPAAEASLLDKVIATVLQPMTLYAVGAAMLLLLAVGFVLRRRNRDADDVTGRWEALESEVDDEAREATQRMRRFAPPADDGISVDETLP